MNKNTCLVKPIPPTTITLITTYKCTAKCKNCCFQCSPAATKKMSYNDMKNYLDLCLEYYPTIKLVVLTGGECFLLYDDLLRFIKYATEKGLSTRIVTNSYWAISDKVAHEKLKALKSAGLKEINFSTGDEHQEWIQFRKVRTAAIAATRLGYTALINVETKDNSKFNTTKYLETDKVFKELVQEKKIIFNSGIWMPYNIGDPNTKYTTNIFYEKNSRCLDLFNNIPIDPYGEIMACCGLMATRIKTMRIGNINHHNIKEIYESSFHDLLKIWLYTDGPYEILKYIENLKGKTLIRECKHGCDYCREIFKDIDNIKLLRDLYKDYSAGVLLNYCILQKENSYE